MAEEEPTPVASEEAPSIIAEAVEVIAEVVEQGADIVEEVAEIVEQAADVVEEVAATATEVAEEVKAVAEEVVEVAEEVKETISETILEEAPPVVEAIVEAIADVLPESSSPAEEAPTAAALLETIAPAVTFVEPSPSLVEAVKVIAPANYASLGSEANDLINAEFNTVKHLKVTTSSPNGFTFITDGTYNNSSGLVGASMETRYNSADCGWSLSSKWNTDSVISNTLSVADQGVAGLNVDIDTSYSLVSGKKTMKVSTAYTGSSLFHPTLDLDVVDITKPNVDFSLVLAHQGFHAGYQTSFDSGSKSLLGHNVSVGYKADKFVLHGVVENASKFIGSVFYKIKEGLSAAAQVEYSSGATPNITVCGKYDIDETTSIKGKIDQNLTLGCSYTTQVKPGLSLTGAGILNAKALGSGGHKIGLSLNFEA